MTNPFWAAVDQQLAELTKAGTADEVLAILSQERNPYVTVEGDAPRTSTNGFFAGSGGDATVREALYESGWRTIWSRASYHYAMRAPDGSVITYVEGDIYARDLRSES